MHLCILPPNFHNLNVITQDKEKEVEERICIRRF